MTDNSDEEFHSADEGEENSSVTVTRKNLPKSLKLQKCVVVAKVNVNKDVSEGTRVESVPSEPGDKHSALPQFDDELKSCSSEFPPTQIGHQSTLHICDDVAISGRGWDIDDWNADDLVEGVIDLSKTDIVDNTIKPSSDFTLKQNISQIDVQNHDQPTLAKDVNSPDLLTQTDQNPLDRLASSDSGSSSLWGGLNSWFSVATDSFNTITSSVGEGFSNVLESTLGVPTPEELAQLSLAEQLELRKKADEVKEPPDWDSQDDCGSEGGSAVSDFGSRSCDELSSGYQSDNAKEGYSSAVGHHAASQTSSFLPFGQWTSVFENTGRNLMTGGIDALETLGKKTFEVLTKKDVTTDRRQFRFPLHKSQPTLSQLLKEVRENADIDIPFDGTDDSNMDMDRHVFAKVFEQCNGVIYFEALELLSKSCEHDLSNAQSRVSKESSLDLQWNFEQLTSLLQQHERSSQSNGDELEQNFKLLLETRLKDLQFQYDANKIIQHSQKCSDWIKRYEIQVCEDIDKESQVIFEEGVKCMACFTALSVELAHKLGQLAVVNAISVDAFLLASLIKILNDEVCILSNKFSNVLSEIADMCNNADAVTPFITNLFLEAAGSSSYIHDAFRFLLPVFKLAVVESLIRANEDHSTTTTPTSAAPVSPTRKLKDAKID